MSTQLNPVVRQEADAEVAEAPGFPARFARFGNFRVDLQREELYQDNQRVKMQAQVYRALLLLLSRAGDIVSREEVRRRLWPEAVLTNLDANVNTTMNKLRQVLGDTPEEPRYIETMPRRGYTFIAVVEFSDVVEPEAARGALEAGSEAATPRTVSLSISQRLTTALRLTGVLMAGVLLGALLMFVWFFAQAKNHRAIQSGRPAGGPARSALLASRICA